MRKMCNCGEKVVKLNAVNPYDTVTVCRNVQCDDYNVPVVEESSRKYNVVKCDDCGIKTVDLHSTTGQVLHVCMNECCNQYLVHIVEESE